MSMNKYNLREKGDKSIKDIIKELQESSSIINYQENVKYNIDNCGCPECMCCDPDTPWLWPVGAGVLAASTPILVVTVAS